MAIARARGFMILWSITDQDKKEPALGHALSAGVL